MSGKRRRPYAVRKTVGWHVNPETGKSVQEQITIGYAATRAEGLQMLAEYNNNPFDIKASKATFQEVYERWSKEKFPTISKSNVKGYEASYRVCGTLYNKVFRDIRLMDLQFVVDTCGKNYPTLKKLKGLFNQLYAYAMKNDICNKDYFEFVDLSRYKDKNPNKRDRNKFTKDCPPVGACREPVLSDRADADLQWLPHLRVPRLEERKRTSGRTVLRCDRQQNRKRPAESYHCRQGAAILQSVVQRFSV